MFGTAIKRKVESSYVPILMHVKGKRRVRVRRVRDGQYNL
jgi:hypothetical protein